MPEEPTILAYFVAIILITLSLFLFLFLAFFALIFGSFLLAVSITGTKRLLAHCVDRIVALTRGIEYLIYGHILEWEKKEIDVFAGQ